MEYHQYEVVKDITPENVNQAYDAAPEIVRGQVDDVLEQRHYQLSDLADICSGKIAEAFGEGGGIQVQLKTNLQLYKDLELLREIK